MTGGGLRLAAIAFVALSVLAQKPCDSGKLAGHPALRDFPRARVVRTICDVREKESARTTAIAWIVSYESGAAAEVRFAGNDVLDVRKLAGQPQASRDERDEAADIVRKALDARVVVGGAFVVEPPDGAPPGRYLELHALSPDRKRIVAELIVDLSRRKIAAERRAP